MGNPETIELNIQDMSGQRQFRANAPTDASWGETMEGILAEMDLPPNTPSGEGVWTGRLEREGRNLLASEIVGDALEQGDRITLQPEVVAG
jgi:hypothetical protein